MGRIILNARELRLLVEAAASLRAPQGDPLFLIESDDAGGHRLSVHQGMLGEPAPDGTVFEVDTFTQQPNRPTVYDVTMTVNAPDESRMAVDLSKYDAVFWSEAAVEKFVLPYYASKSMWKAARVLTALSKAWYGFVPVTDRPGDDTPRVADEDIPFALAHLPSSDYVGVSEDGHNTHLLFRNADGTVRHRPLSDFIGEEEPAPAARRKAGPARRTRAVKAGV